MNGLDKNLIIFTIGGIGYSLIEITWRGYTHWTMALTGGVCFLLLYHMNVRLNEKPLWLRCFIGAMIITVIEFTVGYIVNLKLHWNVWDYSKESFNLMGQICLVSSVYWFFLCIPVALASKYISKKIV